MSETFGYRLKQFALAVDIVDEDTFKQVWELVRRYVSRGLDLAYWALLVEGEVDGKLGLQARESSTGGNISVSLTTGEGSSYRGLPAYAFAKTTTLWVVSPDKQPLGQGTSLQDLWSNTDPKNLPAYKETRGTSIKTVIATPLRWQGRTFGVLDLQMSEYYEITNRTKVELELLVDVLSELLALAETNKTQRAHTLQAIDMLRTVLETESWPPLTKPQIFVASSDQADEEVMGTIRDVLDNFQDRLQIYYWRESLNGGNINLETLREVKASRFGLCYFSEPAEDARGGFKYQDNINVVFEAGMFQSLTNPAATDAPIGWIPVREPVPLSPPPPFDFAQQRMIVIPRLRDNNRLNKETLRANLRARIENLLETG
jgi:hypothetical protein